ncbi:MAG TPA: hypothetical protein VGZ22_11505, partial [Isosphaeraceae bacterium]|nr:hypothetical protein [Isosphaeraceae bacterium]
IEGTLLWGEEPGANEPISLSSLRPDDSPDINHLKGTTADAQGRFGFARVAPGQSQISGLVERQIATWRQLTVEPGKTVHATLGGRGLPVIGRVKLPPEVTAAADRDQIKLEIFLRPPSVSGSAQVVEELFRQYRIVVNSKRGKLFTRDSIPIDSEGRFRVEGLPPAQYLLQLSVPGRQSDTGKPARLAGFLSRRFEIGSPEDAGGREVIDLGTLELRPMSD